MKSAIYSLNSLDWKCPPPNGIKRAFAGFMFCLILLSAVFCGAAAASDGVLNHDHKANFDSENCSLCDLAAKVNALPAASEINEDNALEVELALIAIDQLKYKVFSINDEDYYETWLSLLKEIMPNPAGNGYPIPSQYVNASNAVIDAKGSLVKIVIDKRYMPVDGQAVDAQDAKVTFSLTKEGGSPQVFTLSTVNPNFPSSYTTNEIYSDVLYGSTLTGWTYTLYVPAGTYTLAEVSDSGAILADGTPFVTGSTTYSVDGSTECNGNSVTFTTDNQGSVVTFGNIHIQQYPVVYAVDAETEKQIENVNIHILDNSDDKVLDGTTSESNPLKLEISDIDTNAEYTLHVDSADGYIIPEDTKFKLYPNGVINEYDSTANVDDEGNLCVELTKTKVSIIAVDSETNDKIEGATLKITDTNGNSFGEGLTSGDEAHEIEGLKTGEDYTIKVTEAPDGYSIPEEINFKLDEKGTINNDENIDGEGNICVKFTKTKVNIIAVDSTDETAIEGAHIQTLDSSGNVVEEWDSSTVAHEIKGLKTGEDYTLKVTVAPDGYSIPKEIQFKLNEDGTISETNNVDEDGNLYVELTKTKVNIIAVDSTDETAIEGAALKITDTNGNIIGNEWTSGDEGHEVEGLTINKEYTIEVTSAPDGYSTPDKITFKLNEDGTIINNENVDIEGNIYVKFTKKPVSLSISLDAPDTIGNVEFTVTLSNPAITGRYSDIDFTDGVGTVIVSPGSTTKIEWLPSGIGYFISTPNPAGYILNGRENYEGNIFSDETAKFEYRALPYSVSFDANGGDGEMPEQQFTYDVTQQLSKNTFTRDGYTFAGWMDDQNGFVVYSDKQSVKNLEITTLFANWTANTYNVTFNANGGSGSMAEQIFTYDAPQLLSENTFTRENHAFTGWNTESDGSGTAYNDKAEVQNLTKVNGDTVTLYAQWESTIIISPIAPSTPSTPLIPSSKPTTSTPAEPEITKTITITFDANDGSGVAINRTVEVGKQITLDNNTFVREGFTFKGWATEPNKDIIYTDGQTITADENITLYAVWEEIPVENTETKNGIPVWVFALGAGIIVILIIAGIFIARRR